MSERERQIKDPIYGYVYLPDKYVQGVIDAPEFQRLRKISQTSYEALYPAATHNRFAHSLGVFHLGSIVAKTIREQSLDSFGLSDSQKAKYDEYLEVYRLACLLHDVGHAPFSKAVLTRQNSVRCRLKSRTRRIPFRFRKPLMSFRVLGIWHRPLIM